MKINFPVNTRTTFDDIAIGELFISTDTLYAKSPDIYDHEGKYLGNALIIGETPIGFIDITVAAYGNFLATEEVIPIAEISLKI